VRAAALVRLLLALALLLSAARLGDCKEARAGPMNVNVKNARVRQLRGR
jgi:hypothetical protein